ncbi:MAG: hypothetical protein Q7S09_04755 [bacterium]|nr:hypothetical protein [bacterium]
MAFQTNFQSQLKDPKQKRLLIIAGTFFIVAGIIVYRVFFYSPALLSSQEVSSQTQAVPQSQTSRGGSRTVPALDIGRIKLDTEVVKSELFKELRTYSKDNPVTVPEKGNPNPFLKQSLATPVLSVTSSPPTFTPEPSLSFELPL